MRPFQHVLVTGGAGFLGAHLCARLLALGAHVVCVDNLATSWPPTANRLRGRAGLDFVEYDIAQGADDPRLLGRFDTVFHLASPASPPDYLRLPVETLHAGAYGTAAALDIAERSRARFVLASTSEVYGDPQVHPQPETYWGNVNPVGPRSVYDEAKRFAEALTFAHHRSRGTDIAVARIFNSYGPGMRPDDGRMVPTFSCQALRNEPITVAGTGAQTRSLCHVSDTVAGLLALAAAQVTGPVNIGNPVELTVLQVAELIREHAGSRSPIRPIAAGADDPQRRCPDIEVAAEQLGWEPKIAPAQGLSETVDWFRCQLSTAAAV
ncbi:NAD-dependent epimerase/dehydratase family protein [Mycobacterium sp. 1274756.6]|uniref:NAD-dependent epimerase/dehydratase family protein n=1 Tax=Mycobacterium sp. 1274756.6 TaxID=1834076 RepID=UPI0007FBED41|nr:NAD-dependent epimerase/dehydratase family protein [Mycobacterium sp. 1274756.6]OBJ72456.1 epimerase [Mycobacterium sp. 1274756.6]